MRDGIKVVSGKITGVVTNIAGVLEWYSSEIKDSKYGNGKYYELRGKITPTELFKAMHLGETIPADVHVTPVKAYVSTEAYAAEVEPLLLAREAKEADPTGAAAKGKSRVTYDGPALVSAYAFMGKDKDNKSVVVSGMKATLKGYLTQDINAVTEDEFNELINELSNEA